MVNRRSTLGYFTCLRGNLVTWRSKKQSVVTKSSAKAKFRATTQEICDLLWLRIILEGLRIKWEGSIRLYWYNKSALNIAHNLVEHD